jgi:RNA polymerase sigma factor (sigma-70 family)
MDESALVAALVAGDPRGLDGAYRRHADELYTFCRGLLRDPDAAADAVHDTFLAASHHARQLRRADRLRPWLYAIARNECRRQIRRRVRHVPMEEAGDLSAPAIDPGRGPQADEVRALVWAAADGLNASDRQVFELMVRPGFTAAEVGAALGVSAAHAHARQSRARAQLERALGALLVARRGSAHCGVLGAVLAGWDGRLTVLWRKRIGRHVDACAACADRQRAELRPAALLAAYAALPALSAPAFLRERVLADAAAAGPPARPPNVRILRAVGAITLVFALAAVGTLWTLRDTGGETTWVTRASNGAAPARPTAAVVSPTTSVPPNTAAATGPTAAPTSYPPAPTRGPEGPDEPEAPGEPDPPGSDDPDPPPAPAPLTLTADVRATCMIGAASQRHFTLVVNVVSDGADLTAATLYYSPPASATSEMDPDGTNARTTVRGLLGARVTWWVEAEAAEGGTGSTPPALVANPCPQ